MIRGRSTILYVMGITQRHNGTELVLTLANLAMLCGQIGKPSTGVNPLRGQSNVQGACDMGALPNVLPGYQPVSDATARQVVAQAWGGADLPATPGLTVVEMMHAAVEGKSHAWKEAPANLLTQDFALDSLAKIPEYKVCAVRLERPRSGAHGKPLPPSGEKTA